MDYVKFVQAFSTMDQTVAYYCGGAVMYFVGTKLVPKYGLEGKDLRQELKLAVDSYVEARVILTLPQYCVNLQFRLNLYVHVQLGSGSSWVGRHQAWQTCMCLASYELFLTQTRSTL